MKKLITSYTFDASAQTIVAADFALLEGIQLITNVTDNVIIYNFADATKGGSLSSTTLTLTYDTTSMSDTDDLQIFYEDSTNDPTNDPTNGTLVNLGSNNDVTVTGTVDLGATDNAVLDAIAASDASIDSKTPALGQALAAASVPVILPAATITTLTPPAAITGFGTAANQTTIIGHVDGIETLLGTIDADTSTLAGAVSGTEMQVDVLTMPTVTVTATNLDVQSGGADLATSTQAGAIQTATELIDDAIVADDAAFTPATTKVMMAGFEFDDVTPDSVNEGDAGAARMSANRNIYTTVRDAAGNERGQNVDANGNAGVVLAAETTKVIGTVRMASGGVASGSFASGSIASGAIASGAIAAGAIAAGSTSIATTEDTARAAGEHLVKVGVSRLDTPVANANVSNDGDYTNIITDNFGKVWTAGSIPEDTAHVAGEAITAIGERRIDTLATSAGASGDWATANQTAEGASWSTLAPTTTSGTSTFMASGSDGSSILVATKQTIKASAGNLYGYYAFNPEAAETYVHFYNTDTVTVGTTSPQMTIVIPAGGAANLALPYGISFSTAISCAATTTAGGNSAPATGVSLVAWYK